MPWYTPDNTKTGSSTGTGGGGLTNIDWSQKAKETTPSITPQTTVINWAVDLKPNADGTLGWVNNPVDTPVLLLGDITGAPLLSTVVSDATALGSPVSLDQMTNKLRSQYGSKAGEVTLLKQKLASLGYYDTTKSAQASLSFGDVWDNSLTSAVQQALWTASATNHTAAMQDPTKKHFMSFETWLNQGQKFPGGMGGSGSGGTRTSIVRQQFDSSDYDIAVDELFQRTVGRGASKEELDYFVAQLQSYANANPQKTVTTTSGDTTTSTTTGGVSSQRAESMLRETALNTPGAEQYNKATKYLNYFTEALSSPVRLG